MFWFLVFFFRFGTNSMKITCAYSDKSSKSFPNHKNHIKNKIALSQVQKHTQFDLENSKYITKKAHDGQWKGSRSWYTSCFFKFESWSWWTIDFLRMFPNCMAKKLQFRVCQIVSVRVLFFFVDGHVYAHVLYIPIPSLQPKTLMLPDRFVLPIHGHGNWLTQSPPSLSSPM